VLMSTIRYVLFLFILDHIVDCLKFYHVCCTSQYNLLSSSRLLVGPFEISHFTCFRSIW
jgi:hypothetical protein